LFLREHNRLAELLVKLNPLKYSSDEIIFQTARQINIAQYQHVIFNELLPILIGQNAMNLYELNPSRGFNSDSYFMNYNRELYPSVSIEFSTAAFRFGHSLVRPTLGFADVNLRKMHQIEVPDNIFNTKEIFNNGGNDAYLRASFMQSSDWFDPYLNTYMNDRLFEEFASNTSQTKRFSLGALNVNRGRDHGLNNYNAYRNLCGLNYAQTFDDLNNIPKDLRIKLSKIYASVDDIDLYTGGTSELPIENAVVGVTFACIIAKQFRDLKFGDRLFYENGHDAKTQLTLDQLVEIKKSTMSRLLCDNSDLNRIQLNPFVFSNINTNPVVDCKKQIQEVSYLPWQF
jgi:hypothetical protein